MTRWAAARVRPRMIAISVGERFVRFDDFLNEAVTDDIALVEVNE